MTTVDARVAGSDAVALSSAALLVSWARPAGVSGLAIAVLFLVSPFAGGTVALAGIAYLMTSLLIIVGVILLHQAGGPRPRQPVVVLTMAWTAAWLLGVLAFGLIALLLGTLDVDSGTAREGVVISPVFWLLSFPMYLIFLVAALVVSPHGRGPRRSGSALT